MIKPCNIICLSIIQVYSIFLEPKNSLFCDCHIGMTTIIGISHQDANMRVNFFRREYYLKQIRSRSHIYTGKNDLIR
jgi:hypothetical protein